MRRWTHSTIFEILINGRNSFFNWSLHWRCCPDWGKKLQRANEKRSENKQIQVLLLFGEGDVACFLDQSLRFGSERQRNPILHLTFDWTLCWFQFSISSAVSDYQVRIKTGNLKNAGTDSNIYLQVFGDKGDTGVIELKQICDTKDKFQRGMNTKINLQTVDVGNVSLNMFLVVHQLAVSRCFWWEVYRFHKIGDDSGIYEKCENCKTCLQPFRSLSLFYAKTKMVTLLKANMYFCKSSFSNSG